jgi:iron-sulfur cluster insertion protein
LRGKIILQTPGEVMNTMQSPQVIFSDAAARKVNSLILEEENPKLCLRVYITGGGCSGFQYGFTFDEEAAEDDYVIEKQLSEAENEEEEEGESGSGTNTVRLLIDPMSMQYLVGAEIDYEDGMQGEHFVIRNPNAQTTCGCGSSFSV